jgi:hypothetical protein
MSIALANFTRRLTYTERLVNRLQARSHLPTISTANVSSPPTDAQLDSAFGDAATLPNGFVGIVDDNGAGTAVWLCVVANNNWWYEALTVAV